MGAGVQTSTGMMYQMSRGDDMGGDEVDVFLGVGGASFAGGVGGAGFVGAGTDGFGAFDLNAVEAASVVEDEVVAKAVAPGFGDTEFKVGGFVEEAGFGAFSGDLGIFARGGVAGLALVAFGVGFVLTFTFAFIPAFAVAFSFAFVVVVVLALAFAVGVTGGHRKLLV